HADVCLCVCVCVCVCVCALYWGGGVCTHVPDIMRGGRVRGDTCVALTTVSRGPVWILLAASDMSAAADATAAGVHVKAYPSLAHSLHLALVSSRLQLPSPLSHSSLLPASLG